MPRKREAYVNEFARQGQYGADALLVAERAHWEAWWNSVQARELNYRANPRITIPKNVKGVER